MHNLKGAFKHYNGFPANLCLSVNDCVVHGEPSDYILKSGDLLKIDAGVVYDKGYSDSAISVVI
jgi:methionyl aminopeptidase